MNEKYDPVHCVGRDLGWIIQKFDIELDESTSSTTESILNISSIKIPCNKLQTLVKEAS